MFSILSINLKFSVNISRELLILKNLNEDFAKMCDWLDDNKVSIDFVENKTKSILFASKRKIKRFPS